MKDASHTLPLDYHAPPATKPYGVSDACSIIFTMAAWSLGAMMLLGVLLGVAGMIVVWR
jgi:hypothetical protein